jgi:hypothetical protein
MVTKFAFALLYTSIWLEITRICTHLPLILKLSETEELSKEMSDKMGFQFFPLEWKTEENTSKVIKKKDFFNCSYF